MKLECNYLVGGSEAQGWQLEVDIIEVHKVALWQRIK